jgi:hypothetical protein
MAMQAVPNPCINAWGCLLCWKQKKQINNVTYQRLMTHSVTVDRICAPTSKIAHVFRPLSVLSLSPIPGPPAKVDFWDESIEEETGTRTILFGTRFDWKILVSALADSTWLVVTRKGASDSCFADNGDSAGEFGELFETCAATNGSLEMASEKFTSL